MVIGALLLGACDLLKVKENMELPSKEMIQDPDENVPPGKD